MAAEIQQQQNELDLSAVRRAAQDLVSLQRASSQALTPGTESPGDRQTDLAEGAARVSDSLYALAQQTPFISPKLAESLGRAVGELGSAGRELGSGNRGRGEDAAHNAGAALNEAVLQLRQTESSMCQNPGPGGTGGQGQKDKPGHGQSMQQLTERQGQVNQQSRNLSDRLSQQMRLQAGDQAEVDRLAQEQQRIREQLQEIRRGEEDHKELLGRLDQMEKEMKDVEEVMRAGDIDPSLVEKQSQILSRMLDATRSINRRDFDPERESKPGEDVVRASPPELAPELLRESDRLRLGLLKAEADRYPAQYRAFVESYLKALNGSPR
jgi:hypothetical protein